MFHDFFLEFAPACKKFRIPSKISPNFALEKNPGIFFFKFNQRIFHNFCNGFLSESFFDSFPNCSINSFRIPSARDSSIRSFKGSFCSFPHRFHLEFFQSSSYSCRKSSRRNLFRKPIRWFCRYLFKDSFFFCIPSRTPSVIYPGIHFVQGLLQEFFQTFFFYDFSKNQCADSGRESYRDFFKNSTGYSFM